MVIRPYVLSALAVLPLCAASIWSGFGVAFADPVLGVVSVAEQPLSIRSPGALWALALVLAWVGLALWRRQYRLWEVGLVLVGAGIALARAGNLWLLALALLVPLAHQLSSVPSIAGIALAACAALVAVATSLAARPPALPASALAAVPSQGTVLADWRWALELQRSTPAAVLNADGLRAQSIDFWVDYLRVTQGHERWSAILRAYGVDTVVLDSRDQTLIAELLRTSPEWRITDDADGAVVAQRIP